MIYHSRSYATVGVIEDIDGANRFVEYDPNRIGDGVEVIRMTGPEARTLARKLNRYANFIDPPKKRRRRP